MRELEEAVRRHYGRGEPGQLVEEAMAALAAGGAMPGIDDLAAIDEFHMGGRKATVELAQALDPAPGTELLDIGAGLGGPARYLAAHHGCRVTGIDLTPGYVALAEALTRLVGLDDRVAFRVASALDLPFPAGRFQAATLLHVGMNILDKARLFAEAARALAPGGRFAVYEVMRLGDGEPDYPTAWAATRATSFLAEPAAYRALLGQAGFVVEDEADRRDLALEIFALVRERLAGSAAPPLGRHLLLGEDAAAKLANMVAALEDGRIAPVRMLCRRA